MTLALLYEVVIKNLRTLIVLNSLSQESEYQVSAQEWGWSAMVFQNQDLLKRMQLNIKVLKLFKYLLSVIYDRLHC